MRLFFSSFFRTILALFLPFLVILGMSTAFETMKINGFGEHEKAISVEMQEDGLHVKWFDFSVVIV